MDRYEHQSTFLGEKEQRELQQKTVVIVGIGALGSVAAELLARAGIGKLIIIDHDMVELSNLQRQSLYDETDITKLKANAAQEKLKKINSSIEIIAHPNHLTPSNTSLLKSADIILDCTDNLETRFLINDYCKKNKTPWVHSATAGSIGVILPITNTYCFACIIHQSKETLTCDDAGILNTVSHTTASIQVTEALKILLRKEPTNALIRFNLWSNKFDIFKVKQNPNCQVCAKTKVSGAGASFAQSIDSRQEETDTTPSTAVRQERSGHVPERSELDTRTQGALCSSTPAQKESKSKKENQYLFTIAPCKTRAAYSAKPTKNVTLNLKKIKAAFETIIDTPIVLVIKEEGSEIIVHSYGELLFKTLNDEEKIKKITEKVYKVGL